MLKVHVQLYSILREKLPPASKGRISLNLKEESDLGDVLKELGITSRVVISVNGEHVSEISYRLKNDDQVKIFSSVGGG